MLSSIKGLQLLKSEVLNFRKKYFSEVVWVLIGQVSIIILSIISIKLLTTMPTEEYGKYNLVLASAALLSSVLYGPAEQGFTRYYFEYKKHRLTSAFLKMLVNFLLYAGLVIALIFLGIYWINSLQNKPLASIDVGLMVLVNVTCFVIIYSSNILFNALLNLLRKRKLNTIYSISEKLIVLGINAAIVFYSKLNAQLVLLSMTIAALIFLLVKLSLIKRLFTAEADSENNGVPASVSPLLLRRQMLNFCLPFLLWGITGWIQISSDKFIISSYLNIGNVGLYSLIFGITTYLVSTPINVISQFIQPVIYEKIIGSSVKEQNQAGYKLLNYALVLILCFIAALCAATYLWGNWLIVLLSNKSYLYHINLLPLLCLGVGIFQLAQFYTTFGFIKNQPTIYLPAKIIAGLLAVFFNIYFIKKYQLSGICFSLLLVSVAYFIMVILANKRIGVGLFTRF